MSSTCQHYITCPLTQDGLFPSHSERCAVSPCPIAWEQGVEDAKGSQACLGQKPVSVCRDNIATKLSGPYPMTNRTSGLHSPSLTSLPQRHSTIGLTPEATILKHNLSDQSALTAKPQYVRNVHSSHCDNPCDGAHSMRVDQQPHGTSQTVERTSQATSHTLNFPSDCSRPNLLTSTGYNSANHRPQIGFQLTRIDAPITASPVTCRGRTAPSNVHSSSNEVVQFYENLLTAERQEHELMLLQKDGVRTGKTVISCVQFGRSCVQQSLVYMDLEEQWKVVPTRQLLVHCIK